MIQGRRYKNNAVFLETIAKKDYNELNHPMEVTMIYKTKFSLLLGILFIVSTSIWANAEPYVLVDSVMGKTEVQRAGRQLWQPCVKKMKLFNNDMVHVLPQGFVRLSWPDGTVSYLHQNTQMLITIIQNSDQRNKLLSHATVFFGAVFFLVKKIAPRGIVDDSHLKVYTPTAVLSIRGTAFLTSVDEKTGSTNVKVITGTVQVRNIIKNTALFLGSPYQTTVALKSDPTAPTVVIKSEIDSLKTWVPGPEIAEAMEHQIKQIKKDSYAQSGKLNNNSVVISFSNASSYNGSWPIAPAMAKYLVERLKKSDSSLKISINDSLSGDPIEVARNDSSRFAILGTIEIFDVSQHAEITTRADEYREYSVANVRLRIRLIDALVAQQVTEENFSGEITSTDGAEHSWQSLGKLKFDLNDKSFAESILGKALNQALNQATEKLARYID